MPVPALITDLSTTAASNSPAGGDSVAPDLDNYLRAHASFIAENYANKAPKASPAFTGTVTGAAATFAGDLAAANHYITPSTTGSATTYGFPNANGPAMQFYGTATGSAGAAYFLTAGTPRVTLENDGNLVPFASNTYTLGGSALRWSNVYSVLGNFSGALTAGGGISATSVNLSGLLTASAGVSTTTLLITEGQVISGTYTPTLTNSTNIAASLARACQYMRVGNVVTVSGSCDIDPTAGGLAVSELGISLPVASNFSAVEQCAGTAICGQNAQYGHIEADGTNDRAVISFISSSTINATWAFQFTYRVI